MTVGMSVVWHCFLLLWYWFYKRENKERERERDARKLYTYTHLASFMLDRRHEESTNHTDTHTHAFAKHTFVNGI